MNSSRKAINSQSRKRYAKNPTPYLRKDRILRYGVGSVEHYNTQLEEQKGVCPLCLRSSSPQEIVEKVGIRFSRLHQDHDHACCPLIPDKTGKRRGRGCSKCLRGLLCYACNRRLGTFEGIFVANPELIIPQDFFWHIRAFNYIWKWKMIHANNLPNVGKAEVMRQSGLRTVAKPGDPDFITKD